MKSKLHNLNLRILKGLVAGLMLANPALAGETTITGQNGRTTKVQTVRSKNGNTFTINRNVTYPNGNTSSSTGNFSNNGNGKYMGTLDRQNRTGQTNNYNVEGQILRNGNSLQNAGTITGAKGKQSTFNNSTSCSNGFCAIEIRRKF